MHLSYLWRFSGRPTAWAVALSSLGFAALVAGPASGRSEDVPGRSRVVVEDDFDVIDDEEDDGEGVGKVRILADDEDENTGSASLHRDESGEATGSVQFRGQARAKGAGTIHIGKGELPTSVAVVRINGSSPLKSAVTRLESSMPRKVISSKPVQASRFNPTARRYPFEPAGVSARPAATPLTTAPAVPSAPVVETANRASSAEFSGVKPVQHLSSQRTPFLERDDDRDQSDGEDSAPAMFEEEDRSVALAEADAEPVAVATDCPAVTNEDVQSFSDRIDAATERRPIRTLRADMQMRLSNEHSSLMDENDRAKVREKGRCAAEHDRLVVRLYYRQRYGTGYDRSSGAWSDESLAPEFPFCYHPLYFEDPNLERCGYSQGCLCQSLVSGFQFYGNVALLPVKMLLLPPCSYVYPQCDCDPCSRYSCVDNFLGPCPDSLFRSPCYSNRRCR